MSDKHISDFSQVRSKVAVESLSVQEAPIMWWKERQCLRQPQPSMMDCFIYSMC